MKKGRSLLAGALAGLLGLPGSLRADPAPPGTPISPVSAVQAPDITNFQTPKTPWSAPEFDFGYVAEQSEEPVIVQPLHTPEQEKEIEKAQDWLVNGYTSALKAEADKKTADALAERKVREQKLNGRVSSLTGTNSEAMNNPDIDFLHQGQSQGNAKNDGKTALGFTTFKPLLSGMGSDTSKPLNGKPGQTSTNTLSTMSTADLKALGTVNPDLIRPIQFEGLGSASDPTATSGGLPSSAPAARVTGFQVPNAPVPRDSPYYGMTAPLPLAAPAVPTAPSANPLALQRNTGPALPPPSLMTMPDNHSQTAAQSAAKPGAYNPRVKDPNDISFLR